MNRFDSNYWKNPMFYNEISSISEAYLFINFFRKQKLPCSIFLNGSTFTFKNVDAKRSFLDGLETFLKTGLPLDLLY